MANIMVFKEKYILWTRFTYIQIVVKLKYFGWRMVDKMVNRFNILTMTMVMVSVLANTRQLTVTGKTMICRLNTFDKDWFIF